MEEKEALLKEIKGMVSGFASKEDLDKGLESAIAKAQENFKGSELEKSIEELTQIAKAQGEAIAKMKTNQGAEVQKTIAQQLEAQADVLKRIAAGDTNEKAIVLPTSITSNFNGQVIPQIGRIQQRRIVVTNLFTQSPIAPNHQGVIRYMDQTAGTNGASARAKGAAAGESAPAWTGYTLDTQAISHMIPVEKSMLENYNFIQTEVNNWLMTGLDLKVENDVLLGTGIAPIIKGLATSATEYVNTEAVAFDEAGKIELIATIATKIGSGTMYSANYVLMNDFDALELKLEKTDLGTFKFPNFLGANGMQIENVQIVPTSLVTKNTMYVGDFNYGVFYAKPTTIEIGYNADDFSKRKLSILANIECALLIKALDAGAFYKVSSISDAISSITKGI